MTNAEEKIYSVSEINSHVKNIIEYSFNGYVIVEGEISQLNKAQSGHIYITLKDETSSVKCTLWSARVSKMQVYPKVGLKALIKCKVSFYEKNGTYQLDIVGISSVSTGKFHELFEMLKLKLKDEGLFDIKIDKKRFSMDWYYPIISGAFNRDESKDIIVNTLANFYIEGLGIKCVKEEPWVTVAETNEFVIAAVKADEINLAKNIFLESLNISDEDNIPYMGWQYVENIFWPDEKPSWTAAAVILAADSLYKFTDGSNLFIDMQTKSL